MTVAFVNVGTPTQANNSPQSPGLPATHAAGDLMLLICEQTSAAAIVFTPPAGVGWASIARNSNATRSVTLEVFAKIEGAGESAPSVACDTPLGGWQAAIVNYRGVNNVVIEDAADVSSDAAAAATWQPTGITVGTAGSMVLSVVATKDDNALALNVGGENGYTVRVSGATYDGTAGNGSDYSLGVAEQLFGTTGAKTCPTWNQVSNGNDAWVGLTLSLLGAAPVASLPTAVALTATGATPTVTTTANILSLPTAAALTTSGATPTVSAPAVSLPTAAALTTSGATPIVMAPALSLPTAAALSLGLATPAVATPVLTQPDPVALTAIGAVPSVSAPAVSLPAAVALTLTLASPDVTASDHQSAIPDPAALLMTAFAPDVVLTDQKLVTPGAATLSLTGYAPDVTAGAGALPVAGRQGVWRAPQRLPSPEPEVDQNDLAILLLLT